MERREAPFVPARFLGVQLVSQLLPPPPLDGYRAPHGSHTLAFLTRQYVCDPVMGDHGKLYVPEDLVAVYRDEMTRVATTMTPNQFEVQHRDPPEPNPPTVRP